MARSFQEASGGEVRDAPTVRREVERGSRAVWAWGLALGLLVAAAVGLGLYALQLYRGEETPAAEIEAPWSEPLTPPLDPPLVTDLEEVAPAPPPPAPTPPAPRREPVAAAPAPAPARRASPPAPTRSEPPKPRPTPAPVVSPAPPPAAVPEPASEPVRPAEPRLEPLIPEKVVDGGAAAEVPTPRAGGRILRPGQGATPGARPPAGPTPAPGQDQAQAPTAAAEAIAPPPAPAERQAGDLFWTGKLDKNSIVVVDAGQANAGFLDGDALPGRPVALTTFSAGVEIVEAPGPTNGWKRFSFRCLRSTKGSATVNFRWRAE